MAGMQAYCWWGSGLAIVAALPLRRWLERRRARAMAAVGNELGLTRDDGFDGGTLRKLPLFRLGESGRVQRALRGRLGAREVIVADYRYRVGNLPTAMAADPALRVGSDRRPTYHDTTAIAVSIESNTTPPFELREQSPTDRQLDFPDDPEFSKRFFLAGADHGILARLFGPRLRAYLKKLPPQLCLESDGHWLLLYPWGRTVPGEKLGLYCRRLQWIAAALERTETREAGRRGAAVAAAAGSFG